MCSDVRIRQDVMLLMLIRQILVVGGSLGVRVGAW